MSGTSLTNEKIFKTLREGSETLKIRTSSSEIQCRMEPNLMVDVSTLKVLIMVILKLDILVYIFILVYCYKFELTFLNKNVVDDQKY